MTAAELPIGPRQPRRGKMGRTDRPTGGSLSRSYSMRKVWAGIAAVSALALSGTLYAAQAPAPTPNLPNVPEVYKFDAGWPKPLPNNWVMGTVTGMSVDQDDHIWVLDRPGQTPAGKTA